MLRSWCSSSSLLVLACACGRTVDAGDAGDAATSVDYVEVTCGFSHACALRSDGRLTCWGRQPNSGVGPAPDAEPPGPFVPMEHISSTDGDMCGLRLDGTPVCWGPLPDGTSFTTEPTPLGTLTSSLAGIACGMSSADALCWFVVGPAPPPNVPPNLVQVAATAKGACGLRGDGTPVCQPALTQPDPPDAMALVAAGENFACGLRSADQSLICWGGANSQQLSLHPPAGEFVAVKAFDLTACARNANGAVQCWGDLGDGTNPLPSPFVVPGNFLDFAVGVGFGCGILVDGTLSCWGWNSEGQANPPSGLPSP